MGIKKLKTELKSLPYRQEGSLEPYIIIPVDEKERNVAEQAYVDAAKFSSYDKPVRGGAFSLISDATDLLRISKFLTDWPRGPLFLISQEGLQFSNPQLEPQHLIDIKEPNQNTRFYNFGINTLAQVGVSSLGIHFTRHGLFPQTSINVYEDLVKKGNTLDSFEVQQLNLGPSQIGGNRILYLYGRNILNDEGKIGGNNNLILYKYNGGPNSIYGLGETVINRYVNTTFSDLDKDGNGKADASQKYENQINYLNLLGVSENYKVSSQTLLLDDKNLGIDKDNPTLSPNHLGLEKADASQKYENQINYLNLLGVSENYKVSSQTLLLDDKNLGIDKDNPTLSPNHLGLDPITSPNQLPIFNIDLIKQQDPILNSAGKQIQDFRKTLIDNNIGKGILSYNDYTNVNINIETRINKGNPGKIGINRSDYNLGTGDPITRDTINMIPLYSSTTPLLSSKTRDLIKFRFKALNNDKEGEFIWIHFRAYLSNLSDSNSGEWDSYKYNGRGEKFYTYQGYDRKISFTFKIHPQSKEEMKPLYQKLNYLISNTAPDYNELGFMRGPLVQLNIGDYLSDQTGFISSVGISIPDNSTWEIAMKEPEKQSDQDMQELPKYIEVSIQFTPIHNFVPKKGTNIPFITALGGDNPNNDFLKGDIVANNESEILELLGAGSNNTNSQTILGSSENQLNETIKSSTNAPTPKRGNNGVVTDNKAVIG